MISPRHSWLRHIFSRFVLVFALCMLAATASCTDVRQEPASASETRPERIVSVVPSVTEMLFEFGAGDRVIGVSDFDRNPPEVAARPRIGGLLNPNIERIIELKPDLVIVYGSQEVLRERLKSAGVRMHSFTHGNLDQTIDHMLELGRIIHMEQAAEAVAARIRNSFDDVRALAPAERPKVLLVHNRAIGTLGSFYSVGALAFQHELISIAGGVNIFADVNREVLQPSIEEIISRAPDIIIETAAPPLTEAQAMLRMQDWSKLNLPAVTKGRVYILGEDYFLLPGTRLHLAAEKFGQIIRE